MPALRVRPRPLGWVIVAGLFIFSIPLVGLGVLWLTLGDVAIGVIYFGSGMLLGVFPAVYFAAAKVELSNAVLEKVVLFWKADKCPASSLRSIVWFAKSRYLYGYKFQDADGRTVFTVSPFFWSYTDVARQGQALGVVITEGRAAVEQRRLELNQGAPSAEEALGTVKRIDVSVARQKLEQTGTGWAIALFVTAFVMLVVGIWAATQSHAWTPLWPLNIAGGLLSYVPFVLWFVYRDRLPNRPLLLWPSRVLALILTIAIPFIIWGPVPAPPS